MVLAHQGKDDHSTELLAYLPWYARLDTAGDDAQLAAALATSTNASGSDLVVKNYRKLDDEAEEIVEAQSRLRRVVARRARQALRSHVIDVLHDVA